jgi:hypothetical protein
MLTPASVMSALWHHALVDRGLGGLAPPSGSKHAYRGETAYAKDRTHTPHLPDASQTLDTEDHLFFALYAEA